MFRRLLKLAAVSVPLMVGSMAHASVWEAKNTWSAYWEQQFGNYISGLPLDYFNTPGTPYYGIATDCADAAYTLRTIFAAEHDLPVEFYSHKGLDLTQKNSQFDGISDPHQRLLKFIRYVNLNTDTGTLITDTYSIAINKGSVIPGTMMLHSPRKEMKNGVNWTPPVLASNHVFYVQSISSSGIVNFISSTVPVAVRNLNLRRGFIYAPFNKNSGYRSWKWPGTLRDSLESRLNGSEEQFLLANWISAIFTVPDTIVEGRKAMALQDKNWSDAVRARLSSGKSVGKEITAQEEIEAVIGNINSGITDRIKVVQDAWNHYQRNYRGQGCMNDGDYDSYSTPTRDTRIQTELAYLPAAASQYLKSKRQVPTTSTLAKFYSQFKYEVSPGVIVDLNQIYNTFRTAKALSISEPEHSPQVRWGLVEYKSSKEWPCPHHAKKYLGGENF